jgi:tetratricopeptide (TPR) repeat protein
VPKWDLPERAALIELFKLVDFHPLSIKLVAYQLKERRVGDLARSLEQLLAAEPLADKQRCLIASLNLSLQRLDGELLALLPRLGVFQGGGFELMILEIAQFEPDQWQELKAALLRTGLVQVEVLADVNSQFLRFHPTLASVLWRRLTAEEQGELRLRHQQEYYSLANTLYHQDSQNPQRARISARKELANLLWAVNGALDEGSENTVDFVDSVNRFLSVFGLKRDQAFLTKQLDRLVGTVGSKSWYVMYSSQGEQLYDAGQYNDAAAIFAEILQKLDTEPSFDRVQTLLRLGRCLESQSQLPEAVDCLSEALSLSGQLGQCDVFKRQRGGIYADLGDVLRTLGKYSQSQEAYEESLAISREIGDRRGSAIVEAQLGTLAMVQKDLTTAAQLYKSALEIFQQLQEPNSEASVWHQLGIIYQEDQDWVAADRAYRESAKIKEKQGNITGRNGAANTYNQLAILNERINNLPEAERWYQKAIPIARAVGDRVGESTRLYNLAGLLAKQPNRLPEAHQLAAAALAIKETLDPAAAEIWNTYGLLAILATAQNEPDKAKEYRHLARTTKAAFSGTQFELQQHTPLIELVVAAVGDAAAREQLEPVLVQLIENGWGQLVAAIRRVWAGEREVEALWDDLDLDDSMIIAAILRGVSEL